MACCRTLLLVSPLLALACASPPPTTAVGDNAGSLEFAGLADSPLAGWYSEADRLGLVRVSRDDAAPCGGASSMRVDFLSEPESGAGCPSVSRVIDVGGMARSARFSVDLRGDVSGEAVLTAYVWDGNLARCIAEAPARVSSSWSSHSLEVEVPHDREQVGLFVYLPRADRGSLWLGAPRFAASGE